MDFPMKYGEILQETIDFHIKYDEILQETIDFTMKYMMKIMRVSYNFSHKPIDSTIWGVF